jgi:hypothetical protein
MAAVHHRGIIRPVMIEAHNATAGIYSFSQETFLIQEEVFAGKILIDKSVR